MPPISLQELLDSQHELQDHVYRDLLKQPSVDEASLVESCQRIRSHAQHLNTEVAEMLQELPYYKEWKAYPDYGSFARYPGVDRLDLEIIDVFLFMLNIMVLRGLSAEDVTRLYRAKLDLVRNTRLANGLQAGV